jgi:hypothetical protein
MDGSGNVVIKITKEDVYNDVTKEEYAFRGVYIDDSHHVSCVYTAQIAQGVLLTAPKTYEIISKAGLMNLDTVLADADLGEGKAATVNLAADIDLTGETWTPISRMWFTFNGNGHTISNLTTESTRKAGLFGYAGAVTVNDLTLENVTVTGSQAGAFAGAGEGFTANNCFLKGTNTVNFTPTEETWNGIGAITGVLLRGTVKVTIDKDATVTLNRGDMTTEVGCVYVDDLTGHITTNKGTVTNKGKVETIGTIAYVADSTEALNSAISNASNEPITIKLNNAGTYKLNSASNKDITIVGTKETIIDITEGCYMDSSKIAFEGVTIKGGLGYATNGGGDYAALYSPNVTYTKCYFDGGFRVGRDGAKFFGCTFDLTASSHTGVNYVWTYGNDVTFENCVFNTGGKALLIYNDGGNEVADVFVTGCTFNATTGAKAGAIANQDCAAIEIDNYGNGVALTTSGNTISEKFSGEWRIKNYVTEGSQVIVNDVEYKTLAIDGKTMTIDENKNVTVTQ